MLEKIAAVILSITVFFSSLLMGVVYPGYLSGAEKAVTIPGLDTDFVPQGSTYIEDEDIYLVCGYMNTKSPSRIYLVREGAEKVVYLKYADGSDYFGHAGGITANGEYIYVSNAHNLYVIKKADLFGAQNKGTVSFAGEIPVPCNASFCSCDGKNIYVGEYHADGYETDESHHLTTPDGSEHFAFIFGYALRSGAPFGVDTSAPTIIFSVCDKVQGFAVTDDDSAVLSISAGFENSRLAVYDLSERPEDYELDGLRVPIYYLDSRLSEKTVIMPRMSEDLEYVNGKILICFEAGAKKFFPGVIPFAVKDLILFSL